MKKIFTVMALFALAGCVQVENYRDVVKTPAPAGLAGYWQSQGPQSELVSPEAIASLVVTPQGDTLDCRQWQQVIALQGKLMLRNSDVYNVTQHLDVYTTERSGDTLEYAGMTLKRVERPTAECADWLTKHPFQAIPAQASKGTHTDLKTPSVKDYRADKKGPDSQRQKSVASEAP